MRLSARVLFGALLLTVQTFAVSLNFSGQFAPINWTFQGNGGDGTVDTTGAPLTLILRGSDTQSGNAVNVLYFVSVLQPVLLSFDWSYQTNDSPEFDPAGYSVDGVFTQLTNNGGSSTQTGTVTNLALAVGQIFGFEVRSSDDSFGRARLTIIGGALPPSGGGTGTGNNTGVPEPGTALLLGGALAGTWYSRRRYCR